MASLILGVAGTALGPALFGSGFSLFGAAITGAEIGGAIGAAIGTEIDNAIAPGTQYKETGPRLSDINIQASTEGAPIPRMFGRCRVAGQLIWATRPLETVVNSDSVTGGGKGSQRVTVSGTEYDYSISFAAALCEGRVTKIGRVWADGNLIDLTQFTTRFYAGGDVQTFDPLIEEVEGAGNTPAYRGVSYIVFEDMPLAQFGNRIPQLQFEIIRSISGNNPDALENRLGGVALIPGAGEFVYATEVVTFDDGEGTTVPQNAHNASATADFTASLDELTALAPNLGAVSLVAGWFGDDLRAASIRIMPGVEALDKTTYPEIWGVNGVAREDAHLVSEIDGRPAYGGTPSDQSVVAAIQNLKARGLRVLFYPFLFMDVPVGNALPDPYSGASAQPAYPWRGRVTLDPAPGRSGSPDKTGDATAQIANFFGTAAPSDFTVSGTNVSWSGGDDWGWRRVVLHYAHLCAAAGGVDAFVIGSELRGLTQSRDSATNYPAVAALQSLAEDVKAIFAAAGQSPKLGYAADWSEYSSHQTGDAPGSVLFNLDPLWADANIDFIGIDNYMPLSDWRDGTAHADFNAETGPTQIYDPAYLAANIQGGEDYDWFYASQSDRDAQTRTPIADGTYDKPWVWRAKDIWNWWSNHHFDRAGGTESASHTDWVPQSKPVWFTEVGCPALDKGANQPNVFFDPKSSESALPYYSSGQRDDLIQRRFLEAHLTFWSSAANNPSSTFYSGHMVDTANIYVWCWDARPFPFFPARGDVWGDAPDYQFGHWLNGRLGAVQLPDLVAELCSSRDGDEEGVPFDVSNLYGLVTGFAVTDTMSPRTALTPLSVAYSFDAVETGGVIAFNMRGSPTAVPLTESDLVLPDGEEPGFGFQLARAQESDLPLASRISYIDADADYRQAIAESRKLAGSSDRVAQSTLPIVMDQATAIGIGSRLLQDAWVMRETASFALAPSRLSLDAGDEVSLNAGGRDHRLRISEIADAGARQISAVATDPSLYDYYLGPSRSPGAGQSLSHPGRALIAFLDLPLLKGDETPWAPYAAAYASPWPGAELILRSTSDSDFALDTRLTKPAMIGKTTAAFHSGPLWRWDQVNELKIKLSNGVLQSRGETGVLGGKNIIAVENEDGGWEVVQFATATLTAPNEWTLTKLLRGQAGTESAMRDPLSSGARVVVMDGAPKQLNLAQSEYALAFNYLYGPQGRPISDSSYRSATLQFEGVGLRPYSPVHLDAAWSGSDLVLSWTRRDRAPSSDSWDAREIPMSESSESYDVEILDGSGTVVRAISSVSSPSLTYTAAQISADFPSALPSPFRFTVYQLSSVFGRGSPGTAQIALT